MVLGPQIRFSLGAGKEMWDTTCSPRTCDTLYILECETFSEFSIICLLLTIHPMSQCPNLCDIMRSKNLPMQNLNLYRSFSHPSSYWYTVCAYTSSLTVHRSGWHPLYVEQNSLFAGACGPLPSSVRESECFHLSHLGFTVETASLEDSRPVVLQASTLRS